MSVAPRASSWSARRIATIPDTARDAARHSRGGTPIRSSAPGRWSSPRRSATPANTLPVLKTTALGSTESDTIIGGVLFLYASGSWPLALIVLVASVMIPVGKLLVLGYLLIQVQRGRVQNRRDSTRIYRLVEFIGRWSMLDVFVDAFIVALVQLQPLMSVEPGIGVAFFMAVVVLTILAAQSFDPRLLWDTPSEREAFNA